MNLYLVTFPEGRPAHTILKHGVLGTVVGTVLLFKPEALFVWRPQLGFKLASWLKNALSAVLVSVGPPYSSRPLGEAQQGSVHRLRNVKTNAVLNVKLPVQLDVGNKLRYEDDVYEVVSVDDDVCDVSWDYVIVLPT